MKKIIVGLGNPENKYFKTRHNAGFIILDEMAKILKAKFKDENKWSLLKYENLIFLKPQTYMNNSGTALKEFLQKFNLNNEEILLIYDDIYLPVGKIRYRRGGSHGGHNGVKDILEKLNNNKMVRRIKIGVGYDNNIRIKDWVLTKLSENELNLLNKKGNLLLEILTNWSEEKDIEKEITKL